MPETRPKATVRHRINAVFVLRNTFKSNSRVVKLPLAFWRSLHVVGSFSGTPERHSSHTASHTSRFNLTRNTASDSIQGRFESLVHLRTTRWSTTISSKVNLHHAINFGALCGANLATRWSRSPPIRGEQNLRTPPCGAEHQRGGVCSHR